MLIQPEATAVTVTTIEPILAGLLSLLEEKQMVVASVAGLQHSGKTTFARGLIDALCEEGKPGVIFPMDWYLMGLNRTPDDREVTYLENVGAVEYERDARRVIDGEVIYPPMYDYVAREHIYGRGEPFSFEKGVLILDGLFAFATEGLQELADICIWVETPDEIRRRRIRRCSRGFKGLSWRQTRLKLKAVRKEEVPARESAVHAGIIYRRDSDTMPPDVECDHN